MQKQWFRVQQLWSDGKIAVIGTGQGNGKLSSAPQSLLEETMKAAEIVLIEADGSRQLPCKAPGDREPGIAAGVRHYRRCTGAFSTRKIRRQDLFQTGTALQVCGRAWR